MSTQFRGRSALWTTMFALAAAGASEAAEVMVTSNIATSTTWTANNSYNLTTQIFVLPGATLTIEAGTVIASTPSANGSGSLAVSNGAQIFVQGTRSNPVVMTSTRDVLTWTGTQASPFVPGDPNTGTWEAKAREWGNLTIMGDAYISEDETPGNTPVPSGDNTAVMEGLNVPIGLPASTIEYGGDQDNYDAGSICYLSLRYGGRVVGIADELNGLSLGGLGRGTDIDHVEIMNNVDDGIEIWGGTVNLKYFNIWNIGDDSFDVDQGWRGKAQFGLIVQGYSEDASQGSGIGDNAFEIDGAEDSDWQPVTTTTIYNCTVIGQPAFGDGLTAWRDNARVQYRNCIFMDGGEEVVRFDNVDGDGANGYGQNGTLSWADTWATSYTQTSTVNPFPGTPADFYQSQTSGNLAEITDSVFFRNLNGAAYTIANTVDVFDPANNNVLIPGSSAADAPIRSITRSAPVFLQGGTAVLLPVISLDPRPANEALTSVATAPNDGFFTQAAYRGAFDPYDNWAMGWTAADAFGFLVDPVCQPQVATSAIGIPFGPANYQLDDSELTFCGDALSTAAEGKGTWRLTGGNPGAALGFIIGTQNVSVLQQVAGVEILLPDLIFTSLPGTIDAKGEYLFPGGALDSGAPFSLYGQMIFFPEDPAVNPAPLPFGATNVVQLDFLP